MASATPQGAWRTSIASPEGDFSWEATEKVHHVDHGGHGIFIFPTRRKRVEGGGWVPAAEATPGQCQPGPPAAAEPGGLPGTLGPRLRKWKERGLSWEREPWVPLPAMSSLAPHRGQTLGFSQTLPCSPPGPAGPRCINRGWEAVSTLGGPLKGRVPTSGGQCSSRAGAPQEQSSQKPLSLVPAGWRHISGEEPMPGQCRPRQGGGLSGPLPATPMHGYHTGGQG